VRQSWQLAFFRAAEIPLPPQADGTNINVVDVRMAVVHLAHPLDEVQMGLLDGRIIQIGDRQRALPLVISLKFLWAPFGMVGLSLGSRAAHDPKCQLLCRIVGFLQYLVKKLSIELPGLRLQFAPTPT